MNSARMLKAGILGASGFVGAELLRLLDAHTGIEVIRFFGDSASGKPLGEVHPHVALGYPGAQVQRYAPELLDGLDLVFAALPHGHSQDIAGEIIGRGLKFVDLGADFRLHGADSYAQWYGEAHKAPDLLGRFVYGIPELHRDAIRT